MTRQQTHCLTCASPVIETLSDAAQPVFSMEIVKYSCGAVYLGPHEEGGRVGRIMYNGCGSMSTQSVA